jgi:tetratricopeptide (TPR) repeat protein
MSTKGNSGGDGFFDDFEDDFFKSGEDDSFWSDDTIDAYDASAAIPKDKLEEIREALDEDDAEDEAAQAAPEPPAAPEVPAAPTVPEPPAAPEPAPAPRAEAFVPSSDRGERAARPVPQPPASPFIMPMPTVNQPAPAPAPEEPENAPDTVPDTALFSAPTLIIPRDDEPIDEEVPAPAAAAPPELDEPVPPAPPVPSIALPPPPAAEGDFGGGDVTEDTLTDDGLLRQDTVEIPREDAPGALAMGGAEDADESDEDAMMVGETVGAAAVAVSQAALDARLDGGVMDESEEEEASAEDFVGQVPDDTMILRREPTADEDLPTEMAPRPAPAAPTELEDVDYSAEEVRLAREERAARRASEAATPEVGAPPPVSAAPVAAVKYAPSTDEGGTWAEAAAALEREAAVATEASLRGRLLAAAGRIHFSRRGSWDDAERCFAGALEAGEAPRDVLVAYGHVVASKQSFGQLRDALLQRAEATGGGDAAEALHDAALVTRNHLRDDAGAVALLGRALEQAPDDWFSLRLLREQLHRTQDWAGLVDALGRMAAVVGGGQAARLLVEQGRVLEQHLDRADDARAAYQQAREADPRSVEAFLALERFALAARDHAALAALYAEEAAASEGQDAAFFHVKAARAAERSGDAAAATAGWDAAVAAAGPGAIELLHEQQAFLSRAGDTEGLEVSLRMEAEGVEGAARAAALFRLARLLEADRGDAEAALAVYRDVVAADPAAGPAAEAVARLLRATGQHAELLAFMAEQLDAIDDPNLLVTTLYRMGELCEGPLQDGEGARKWFERILQTAPGYLPALEGLERVYSSLGEWAQLASIYEQRAGLAEDPADVALQLHRAGSVHENRIGDADQGLVFYKRALENLPHFPPSLDAHNRLASAAGEWGAVAAALQAAAGSTSDANAEVSLTYRAARVLADHAGDADAAMAGLRRCLELSPGFLPAILLLRDLAAASGSWRDVYQLQQLEADGTQDLDRRAWRMLVAADAASQLEDVDALGVIRSVLDQAPSHAGAQAALEVEAHRTGDADTVLLLLRQRAASAEDDAVRARVGARLADAASEVGDDTAVVQALSEVAHAQSEGRPLQALARLAERLGFWEEAERALAAEGSAAERARLCETWSKDPDAVVAAWRAAFEADDGLAAAAGLERALSRAGSRDGLAAAHGRIADTVEASSVAAVHGLLAGHLLEADGDKDGALARYEAAFAARPGAGKAFDALRRLAVQGGDAEQIAGLYARLEGDDGAGLLDALESADAHEAAARVLRARLEAAPGDLEALVHLEQVLAAAGEWKAAFEALGERLAVTGAEDERAAITAKRRWVLAEHLADTDEAWDFYRQLHEEAPDDAEVLEALARIAGARGETTLAVEYLEGLASRSSGAEAARYQRRIAEVQERAGDTDATLAALMRALDHHPEDTEALAELRRLHSASEDWRALVGVLAREATVLEGEAQLDRYREIASVWEDRIGEPAVAMDAWRKVLDLSPEDGTALEHLVSLSRDSEDWSAFTEYGQAWLRHAPTDDRVALQSELGQVFFEHLRREDEALRFLDAASAGDAPDAEAARLYERIYEARGNWAQAVEGVLRQARATEGEEAVGHYLRAAQRRIETLHDKDGAAEIYRQVLDVDAENGEALRFLGGFLYDAGDLEGAVDVYARMVDQEAQRDLDDFDVQIEVALFFFRFAESLRQLERPEEALQRYEQGLELNPSHLPSLEAVGPLYMEGERWDAAAKVYRQILQLTGGQGDPERLARTYTNLGKVEFHLGNLDKAKKRFNKALELRANDIRALQGIASVLFARSDWNNLLNVYNNIIYHAQEPGEVVDAYLTKGFVLDAKMGLPDKARQHYEKSLAFDPGQPAALLRLGELALRQQDWPEAASLADRGLALEPEDKRLVAGLYLVKVVAYGACGDAGAASAARSAADAADVTLAGALGDDATAWEQVHQVLRTRLQAQL